MAGKRTFKQVVFDRSEGATVIKTLPLPEGGAMGYFSVWNRRVSGAGNVYLTVYGSFNQNPTEDERYELNSGGTNDFLDTFLSEWYAEWSYLTIKAEFDDPDPTTVEVYIASY